MDLKLTQLEITGVIRCSGAVAQDGKSPVQVNLPHVSHCHPSSAPPQQIAAGLINVPPRRR